MCAHTTVVKWGLTALQVLFNSICLRESHASPTFLHCATTTSCSSSRLPACVVSRIALSGGDATVSVVAVCGWRNAAFRPPLARSVSGVRTRLLQLAPMRTNACYYHARCIVFSYDLLYMYMYTVRYVRYKCFNLRDIPAPRQTGNQLLLAVMTSSVLGCECDGSMHLCECVRVAKNNLGCHEYAVALNASN